MLLCVTAAVDTYDIYKDLKSFSREVIYIINCFFVIDNNVNVSERLSQCSANAGLCPLNILILY